MTQCTRVPEETRRRNRLKHGGEVTASAVLAGCSDCTHEGGTGTPGGGRHSATMPPVGTVESQSVPERFGTWPDAVDDSERPHIPVRELDGQRLADIADGDD